MAPNKQATQQPVADRKHRGKLTLQQQLLFLLASACALAAVNFIWPWIYDGSANQTLDIDGSSSSSRAVGAHQAPAAGNTLPSFGVFPRGCKWREVQHADNTSSYQYWHAKQQEWLADRPSACAVAATAKPGPPGWQFHKGTPRTEVVPHNTHVLYTNLWYNNGRWYVLVDGDKTVPSWRFSRNQELTTLHVHNAQAFADSVNWRVVRGDTLLFDYIYFIHPTAIGHWWEMLAPLFSILKTISFARPVDQLVLLHLKRSHLMEWARAVLAVALGVSPEQDLPPVLLQEERDSPWEQIVSPLEGVPADTWLVFEHVLIVRDIFTGGSRTFASTEDARDFRQLVYQHYGLPAPNTRVAVPRTITFQRKRANRRIVNERQFLQLLRSYAPVQVVEFNASSSLLQQLQVVQNTGVFVSVHTSNLANTPFLLPGSAVVEIIQRHWQWNRLDQSFKDQTSQMGDIHHYAWRANFRNETVYLNPRDEVKYGHWTGGDCSMEDCVESHTNVDVMVDLPALQQLLDSRLSLVFKGTPVTDAALPWPPAL